MPQEERPRVFLGKLCLLGKVQADVMVAGKQSGEQGGLAGLAGTRDHHRGEVGGQAQHRRCNFSLEFHSSTNQEVITRNIQESTYQYC